MPCLETILRSMYLKENSINLDERFGGDTDIPANPKTKKYIESGKGIIVDVQSSLHSTARFAIYKNPAKGSKQDKVIMATISDPKRGKVKMFAFHGSHVSHQKAMDFAAKHKLIALKDKDGNRLHSKYESVELDEGVMGVAGAVLGAKHGPKIGLSKPLGMAVGHEIGRAIDRDLKPDKTRKTRDSGVASGQGGSGQGDNDQLTKAQIAAEKAREAAERERAARERRTRRESVELDERTSGPTRMAIDKEFTKMTRSGRMDTMAAIKHVEKMFKVKNVKVAKDKRGKPYVISFNESVELSENISTLEIKKEVRSWLQKNIKKFRNVKQAVIAAAEEFGLEDEIRNRNHWLWKMFKKKTMVAEEEGLAHELEEKAVPVHQYKNMMKWYETSPERKVYDILDRKGWRIPADGFALVQNMVKKNAGNAKKAADEIMKRYPNFQMESVEQLDEMDPKEHVRLNKSTGMYCVYNKGGEKVKEFKDKADADKWATDNHDSLMESMKDVIKKVAGSVLGKKRKPAKWRKDQKSPLVKLGQGDFQRTIRPKDIK